MCDLFGEDEFLTWCVYGTAIPFWENTKDFQNVFIPPSPNTDTEPQKPPQIPL